MVSTQTNQTSNSYIKINFTPTSLYYQRVQKGKLLLLVFFSSVLCLNLWCLIAKATSAQPVFVFCNESQCVEFCWSESASVLRLRALRWFMCICVRAWWTVLSSLSCSSVTTWEYHTLSVLSTLTAPSWGTLSHTQTHRKGSWARRAAHRPCSSCVCVELDATLTTVPPRFGEPELV